MRKSFKTVILILFNLSAFAQNQPLNVDGIVAAIGDQIILQSDIIFQKQALSQEGRVLSDCDMLKEISLEKLLIHHAAIDSVEVTNEEIDESIDRRIQQLVAQIGSERKMEEYYKKSILLIKEEMRPLMKNQMISQRMQMTVAENIQISPIEVEEMIQEMPVDSLPLIGTEVELAQIIIEPEVSKESITETIERLNTLRERILNGSSFSSMAILYSEDPGSNRNGGEYKGLKRGQFVKEFEAVAFNLRPGEVSKPFKTDYGYHIVQLQIKRGEELDLRHILIKPKVEQEDLDIAKKILDSLRVDIIGGKISFEEVAKKYSSDDESKLNGGVMMNPMTTDTRWNLEDLDRSIFYAIEKIEVGEISSAALVREQDGKEIFRILQLRQRIAPHRANLNQDFSLLKNYVENQKRQEKLLDWVSRKKNSTYIFVAPKYRDCQIL
jgi:peptidyl-prolyl cis-trans isomerase SurA|tara:strand:- start:2001 stop:3317 length:1317 start_codon:yes stop_codon:yes gene_type:complete